MQCGRPRRKKRESSKNIFEDVMIENFTNLVKKKKMVNMQKFNELQVQHTEDSQTYIAIKLSKTKKS